MCSYATGFLLSFARSDEAISACGGDCFAPRSGHEAQTRLLRKTYC
jgi:hypothetical protein